MVPPWRSVLEFAASAASARFSGGLRLVEARLEGLHLRSDRLRQTIAELREVLLHLRHLVAQFARIDAAQNAHVLFAQVEPLDADLALGGHQPEERVLGLGL